MSFKTKLVGFFIVLSLFPLASAFWGFNAASERSESKSVDARLDAGLRAALAAYTDELARAGRLADRLAADVEVQRALTDDDSAALGRLVRENPTVRVRDGDGTVYGTQPVLAGSRRVNVLSERRRLLGTISAHVALDEAFLARLRNRAALQDQDRLILARDGLVVAGYSGVSGTIPHETRSITTLELSGDEYRTLSAALVSEPEGASLAVISPSSALAEANASVRRRLIAVVLGSLLLIGAIAYALGRGIVRNLAELGEAARELAAGRLGRRVPERGNDEFALLGRAFNDMAGQLEERVAELELERTRLREVTARLGEALGATHDPDQLLRVVVETAVEVTGASGGVIVDHEGRLFQVGVPKAGRERLELPLTAGRSSFGTLLLTGDDFDTEQREIAVSLASHAVMALENARLHRIVERQALVDGLTGLANRRSAEDTLAAEFARAERFATPLTVVLADLDDFKTVNDTYGHACGDAVLRELGNVLRESVREIDLAARWGGEEFALVLPGTDLAGGLRVAERIRAGLEKRIVLTQDGVQLRITASFGVASFPDLESLEALLRSADLALYGAKRAGKNRVLAGAEAAGRP